MMNRIYRLLLVTLATASSALASAMFPQQIEALERDFEKLGEYRYVYRMFFKLYG